MKKDVILSAGQIAILLAMHLFPNWQRYVGAFQTPHLLELSGIGDQSILKKHGIGSLINLPGVGENLRKKICSIVLAFN